MIKDRIKFFSYLIGKSLINFRNYLSLITYIINFVFKQRSTMGELFH